MVLQPEGRACMGYFGIGLLRKNCGLKREEIILKLIELHNGKLKLFVLLARYY